MYHVCFQYFIYNEVLAVSFISVMLSKVCWNDGKHGSSTVKLSKDCSVTSGDRTILQPRTVRRLVPVWYYRDTDSHVQKCKTHPLDDYTVKVPYFATF